MCYMPKCNFISYYKETNTVMFTKYLAAFSIASIALIQPKPGPQSSGTPFPVKNGFKVKRCRKLYMILKFVNIVM